MSSVNESGPDGVFNPLSEGETLPGGNEAGLGAALPSPNSEGKGGRALEDQFPILRDLPAPEKPGKKREPKVSFWSPSQLCAFEPPANQNMLGDYHLQRGAISVLAGPPGCGKSRAALWLAMKGAEGCGNWLGFEVHSKFRTLILQNENGLARLHRDFAELNLHEGLDEWLRISEPPATGLNLLDVHFRADLKNAIREFSPHLVVVDPWNAMARDAMEKDYQQAFELLRECLHESSENAACLILHHLRKPKSEDKHRGRSLGNLLAGSYTIISVPRSVIILQPASDDTENSEVVVTPAKNNDGELGKRTAWTRGGGGFVEVDDFDWNQYDEGTAAKPRESKVQEHHLRELFENGRRTLPKAKAAAQLQEIAKVGRTAAYEALALIGGRFSFMLRNSKGEVGLADGDPEKEAKTAADTAPPELLP